jgi:hypothetical protein
MGRIVEALAGAPVEARDLAVGQEAMPAAETDIGVVHAVVADDEGNEGGKGQSGDRGQGGPGEGSQVGGRLLRFCSLTKRS